MLNSLMPILVGYIGFPTMSGFGVCRDFRNGFFIGIIPPLALSCIGISGEWYSMSSTIDSFSLFDGRAIS